MLGGWQGRNICFKQLQRLEDCEFRPKPYELGTHPYVRKSRTVDKCIHILLHVEHYDMYVYSAMAENDGWPASHAILLAHHPHHEAPV